MSAIAVRTRHPARPGRRAIVVTDLDSLRGPVHGTVELPLRLFWSSPDRTFDLDKPYMRRWLYQTVLREASHPEDLTRYLDRSTLIALWPGLHLPAGVRQAWEEHHPALRAAQGRPGLMPVSPLHYKVASVALGAAAGHGFALGGGNALLAHGVITRSTQDVDLFTDREHGVEAAAGVVEAALRDAGFHAERQDQDAGLADIFPGMGEGLAEWIVTAPGGEELTLQLAYFDRAREPVGMEVGPVLDIEDVAGGKACALAGSSPGTMPIPPGCWRGTARPN